MSKGSSNRGEDTITPGWHDGTEWQNDDSEAILIANREKDARILEELEKSEGQRKVSLLRALLSGRSTQASSSSTLESSGTVVAKEKAPVVVDQESLSGDRAEDATLAAITVRSANNEGRSTKTVAATKVGGASAAVVLTKTRKTTEKQSSSGVPTCTKRVKNVKEADMPRDAEGVESQPTR